MVTQGTRVPKPYWFGSLPDHALMQELRVSHEQDRAHTARLVALLAEVEKRRLHGHEGYASLFSYCVGALHMSEDVAWKRIQAARAARRHPSIFERLADGRLTLTAIVLLDQHLTRENAAELLDAATHRSKREVQELLATRFPQPDIATLIAPLPAMSIAAASAVVDSHSIPVASHTTSPAPERVPDISCTQVSPSPTPAPAFPRLAPLSPERYELHATISRETHEKLRRAQELLGHAASSQDIAQVLDRALALLVSQLEKHRCGATDSPRPRRSHANGRYVPAEVRREVFERDGQQCTYVSDKGHRCEARSKLELDHVIPLAKGGKTEAANLRLLCRQHNQHEAERVLGAGFMRERGARPGESSASRGTRIDAHSQLAT